MAMFPASCARFRGLWLAFALLVAGGAGPATAGPSRDDFRADLEAGRAAAAVADWDTAIDHLHAAVAARPADAAARRELGSVYLRAAQARDDPALRRVLLAMADLELDQAVRLAPQDRGALRAWAEVSILNRNPDRAIRLYEDILAARGRGEDTDAAQLFTLYLALGKEPRGLHVFSEKLRAEPNWQELRFLLASLYLKAGNPAEARPLLRRVADARDSGKPLRELALAALRGLGP
jgi:tetratricopeptide (TPR) repeat protein